MFDCSLLINITLIARVNLESESILPAEFFCLLNWIVHKIWINASGSIWIIAIEPETISVIEIMKSVEISIIAFLAIEFAAQQHLLNEKAIKVNTYFGLSIFLQR